MKNIILETGFINDAMKKLSQASNKNEIAEKLGLGLESMSAEYYGDNSRDNSIHFTHSNFSCSIKLLHNNEYNLSGGTSSYRLHNITEILTYASSITSFVENINENIALALSLIK